VNSIFFISKLVYRVEIRFSHPKKMPKSCTKLENDGENHRTTILVAHLLAFQVRRGATTLARQCGRSMVWGTRWYSVVLVVDGHRLPLEFHHDKLAI